MAANGAEEVRLYDKLKRDRFNFDDRWERMAPYLSPSREGIITKYSPGEKQQREVYDSTAIMAGEVATMFIAGNIINPSQQWMSLRMRQDEFNERDQVREWLEESRDRQLKRYASSMFYAEAPEALQDYMNFGTGCILAEELPQPKNRVIEGFRGLYFQAQKIGRYVIAEGADGLVDTVLREFQITPRIAIERWGEASLSGSMRASLRAGEIERQFTVIHSVRPRPRTEFTAGAKAMPWMSAWVEKESKHVLHEGGYKLFPFAVPRYLKTPGEVYGRGRGDIAFSDIWTLNTAKRMGLEDWALKIRPPVLTRHDSVIGTLRLVPAGPTSVNTHGMSIRDVIMPYETGSRPEVSQLKEEELRKTIRQIFYVDQILALLEVQKTEMTAYEYSKKIELLFRLLGPVYGRMEWELLNRNVDVTFQQMWDGGEFSDPPDEIYESDGQIDVEFQNPIAKAQRAGDVEAINLAINDLAPLGQIFPQIWDGFDPDKTRDHIFQVRGVPAKATRSEDEIEIVRKARQEKEQQELALAQTKEVSESVRNVVPMAQLLQGRQPGKGA